MRFDHDTDDGYWEARPSHPGPAGVVALALDPVHLEFDRIDHGRLVRLVIFDDADDEVGLRRLGPVWTALHGAGGRPELHVDLSSAPLWSARSHLAAAAQLTADVERLRAEDETAPATIAAAELAQIWHVAGEPDQAHAALAAAVELLARAGGALGLPQGARAPARALAARLGEWAPAEAAGVPAALDAPLRTARRTRTLPADAPLGDPPLLDATSPEPVLTPVVWRGDSATAAAVGQHVATLRWHDGLVDVTVADPAPDRSLWAVLFDDTGELVGGGPLTAAGAGAHGRFGPLARPPASAGVLDEPFRSPVSGLAAVERATRLGIDALAREPYDPAGAAQQWRGCAVGWLGLSETGRAAIADDRAAVAYTAAADAEPSSTDRRATALTSAARVRARARAFAPPWARSSLGGRTGTPFRPVWTAPSTTTRRTHR